ncbi:rhamnan synthesis F family protein, partial [Yoonia sp.]|uniref:rhamnan synthesis F family protein n=1 Tax=Yoonia sp. TaxID=2212373 RepID=UPI003976ACA0
VYNKMEARPIDFWGITKHKYQEPDRFLLNKPIPEHIQSYFMVFNRRVVASSAFKGFWRKVNHHTTKRKLVQDYELKLTSHLATSGFRYGTVTDEIECPQVNF